MARHPRSTVGETTKHFLSGVVRPRSESGERSGNELFMTAVHFSWPIPDAIRIDWVKGCGERGTPYASATARNCSNRVLPRKARPLLGVSAMKQLYVPLQLTLSVGIPGSGSPSCGCSTTIPKRSSELGSFKIRSTQPDRLGEIRSIQGCRRGGSRTGGVLGPQQIPTGVLLVGRALVSVQPDQNLLVHWYGTQSAMRPD